MKTHATWNQVLVVAGLLVGWTLTATSPLRASEGYREKLRDFAGEVKKFLDERKQTTFFLGDVTAMPPVKPVPAVRLMLKEELEKLGVTITLKAEYGFTGSFRRAADDRKKLELKAIVVNQAFETEMMKPYRFDALPETPKGTKGP